MGDVAICVEGLGKRYRIGQRQQYKALRDVLAGALRTPARAIATFRKHGPRGLRHRRDDDHIWALKDVSFEINRGEVVGIIGRNGAGKSTLLKILSRITEPTEGRARIRGRVGSLLEIGTGFHPELTGRENVYLNGAILGLHKVEIDRKFDEIVAFAELERFLDTPVKYYSSGMYIRLAFAVAAHLETEILLVDEVLAVGDAQFQKKCLGKMEAIANVGRTVLFVSHNLGAVNSLCSRALLIDKGSIQIDDSAKYITAHYLRQMPSNEGNRIWKDGISNPGIEDLKVFQVCIIDEAGEFATNLDIRNPHFIELRFKIYRPLPYLRTGFWISTVTGEIVFSSYDSDDSLNTGRRIPGKYVARCCIPGDLLNAGHYNLTLHGGMPGKYNLFTIESALSFSVNDTGGVGSEIGGQRRGLLRPRLKWEVVKEE